MTTLTQLDKGRSAVIEALSGTPGFVNRAAAMGFTPGARVTAVQNTRTLPLLVHLRDTLVAIDRHDAERIAIHEPSK